MSDHYGPATFRCIIYGCNWRRWVGKESDAIDVAGRKCERCGRWEYEDGSTMPPIHD